MGRKAKISFEEKCKAIEDYHINPLEPCGNDNSDDVLWFEGKKVGFDNNI